MEKISAANAMEWSIELEKALRSKKPGHIVEAISNIGSRLGQWGSEPEPAISVYNVFGLVPAEDKLFVNTILLRLASAFQLGDKHVRLATVRAFLSVRRQNRKKKSNRLKGILSKARVYNHLELLSRAKFVYDIVGDVEARAMALVIFGCWADFAKDNAQIRYLILSSLLSSHVLEVRASLFAAGCFSELADDFAIVVIDTLVDIVSSPETIPAIKLAGLRVFAKMSCSRSVAYKAYKTGLKLLSDFSEEDSIIVMLLSLSKLASRSTLLVSEQVDLLLSFLCEEKTLHMQVAALKCLHLIFRQICYSPDSSHVIRALLSMLVKPELVLAIQFEALQILGTIHSYGLQSINKSEFTQLLTIVENAPKSPITSKSLIPVHVLANISLRILKPTETISFDISASDLQFRVVALLLDWIMLLGVSTSNISMPHSEVFQEVKRLFNLILLVVGENTDLGLLVLDKISLLIEGIVDYKGDTSIAIRSKLLYYVNNFLVVLLDSLDVAGSVASRVYDKLKLLVQRVHQYSVHDYYTLTIYSLLLHSRVIWGYNVNGLNKTCNADETSPTYLPKCLDENDIFTLECTKKMLKNRDYWLAYRVGIHAACQGAWITSSFIFEHLTTEVQSASCSGWIKSLTQFTHCEGKIQLLLQRKGDSSFVDWVEANRSPKTPLKLYSGESSKDTVGHNNEPNYGEVLTVACKSLYSSQQTLENTVASSTSFFFQTWFLSLRTKVLGAVVDILELLGCSRLKDIRNNDLVKENRLVGGESLLSFTQVSVRLTRLVHELDLMARSFIDMDKKSLDIIISLALSCSVLAFCSGFSLFIPMLIPDEGSEGRQTSFRTWLVQNLVGRIWHIDPEISKNLCLLLEVSGQDKNSFDMQPQNQILRAGSEISCILGICGDAVSGILCLQNEANKFLNDETSTSAPAQVTESDLHFLLDVMIKYIHIPFRVPKHFFKTRPSMGSLLFTYNADTDNRDVISVLPGFHLSLDLCLQLKNMPPKLSSRIKKLYCVLHCNVSFQGPEQLEQLPHGGIKNRTQTSSSSSSPQWETDEMVEMNDKLFQHVVGEHAKRTTTSHGKRRRRKTDGEDVYAFVCFEPNERGQGFSTCLLDVSRFPEGGCYQIKWHSCFVDSRDSYWSLLPLNSAPVFTVHKPPPIH